VVKYVDQLVIKLQEHTMEPLDMCKWFNLVCFDIIGDLMFSDSFESLHSPDLRVGPSAGRTDSANQFFSNGSRYSTTGLPEQLSLVWLRSCGHLRISSSGSFRRT